MLRWTRTDRYRCVLRPGCRRQGNRRRRVRVRLGRASDPSQGSVLQLRETRTAPGCWRRTDVGESCAVHGCHCTMTGGAPLSATPESEAAGDLEEHREYEGDNIAGQSSSSVAKNSRVPSGPESSSAIGPPSGATVTMKRRKRQHWRSASTARAIIDSVSPSAEKATRKPSGVSSWL